MAATHIQNVPKVSTTNTQIIVTVTATGINNLVVVAVDLTAGSTPTVTDNASTPNTYHQIDTSLLGNGASQLYLFYGVQTTGGATQVIVNISPTSTSVITVDEFAGTSASPFDKSNKGSASSGTAVTVPSYAPTQNGELIVATGWNSGTAGTWIKGTSYDAIAFTNKIATEYRLAGATAETSPMTAPNTGFWSEISAAFFIATSTTTKTLLGKARITATTIQTLLGKSRLTAKTTQTLLGNSRLSVTTSQTLLGKAQVLASAVKTLLGKSRLTAKTSQTLTGVARIKIFSNQTLLGKAKLLITTSQTLLGKARVTISSTRTLSGVARLTISTSRTLLGTSRISITSAQTILGKARITIRSVATLLGKSRLTASTAKTLLGRARITISTSHAITGKASISSNVLPPVRKIIYADGKLYYRLTSLFYIPL